MKNKIYKIFTLTFLFMYFFINTSFAKNILDTITIPNEEFIEILNNNDVQNIELKKMEIDPNYIILSYSEELDKIIFAQNEKVKINPASITKILTAILAIENLNLNENITITNEDIKLPPNYVSVPVIPSEKISIKNLISYTLIPSCNDAAKVLERTLNENTSGFLKLTNDLFKKLDIKDSNVTNSFGLADNNHFFTANDILKLTKYALKNEIFKKIVKESFIEIPKFQNREYSKRNSTNLFLLNGPFYRDDILGVKTGYNEISGYFLVSYKLDENSKNKNNKIINIVGNLPTENDRYTISNNLYYNDSKIINLLITEKNRIESEKFENKLKQVVQKNSINKNKYKTIVVFFCTLIFIIFFLKPRKKTKRKRSKIK